MNWLGACRCYRYSLWFSIVCPPQRRRSASKNSLCHLCQPWLSPSGPRCSGQRSTAARYPSSSQQCYNEMFSFLWGPNGNRHSDLEVVQVSPRATSQSLILVFILEEPDAVTCALKSPKMITGLGLRRTTHVETLSRRVVKLPPPPRFCKKLDYDYHDVPPRHSNETTLRFQLARGSPPSPTVNIET